MRTVRRAIVVLVLLAVILAVGDVVAKDGVQSAIASRIEDRDPGSHATVTISSFPFVGRLAASGAVPSLDAVVTDLHEGGLVFDRVELRLVDLRVKRSALLQGKVEPVSIGSGTVSAEVTQASVDASTHLPVVLGNGTVGADGVELAASVTVSGDRVLVQVLHAMSFSVTIPVLDVLPCVGAARIVPGALELSCSFSSLPPVLAGTSFRF